MFRNSLREFEEDPFFSGFPSRFSSSLIPFESRLKESTKNLHHEDSFQNLLTNMNNMMSMHSQFDMHKNDENIHSFTSSTVTSYRDDGRSQPKIMQASKSTRRAPGQIKETRRSYRDNEAGIEKMSIGHHIGRRGHEIERRRHRGGVIEEERRFHEINDDDVRMFDDEWRKKAIPLPSYRYAQVEKPRHHSRMDGRGHRETTRPIGPSKSGRTK